MWETIPGLHGNRERSGCDRIARRRGVIRLTFNGVSKHFEQLLMIEWFGEELDCTLFHGLSPYFGVVKRRNKDDGNVAFLLLQLGLQFQTRYVRHADVDDQARRPAMGIGLEERFC